MTLSAAVEPAWTGSTPGTLSLGTVTDARGRPCGPLRVPLSVLTGQVLVTGGLSEVPRAVACLLGQLNAAGIPWLRIGRLPAQADAGAAGIPVTLVDLSDPHGIPLTLDPFQPEPGYPPVAHASALCALLQAVFGLPDPVGDVLALALRRVYAGPAAPGLACQPSAPPTARRLERAVLDVARELGHDGATEAALRGLVRVRIGGLRGPLTGLLLGGGHPASTPGLLRRNVDVATGDADGAEGRALVAGTVLLRVAEHARRERPAVLGIPRHVLVIEEGGLLFDGSRAAQHVGQLLGDAAASGTGVIVTEHTPWPVAPWLTGKAALTIAHEPGTAVVSGPFLRSPVTITVPRVPPAAGQPPATARSSPGPATARSSPGPRQPGQQPSMAGLAGRRSAACGRICAAGRACTRHEISVAGTLADAPDVPDAAWLRIWLRVLILAFLTGRPLPAGPAALRAGWGRRQVRTRECALATHVERAVADRATALCGCYPPEALTRTVARVAVDMLDGRPAPCLAGQVWVIPQLRWAHEAARVGWNAEPGAALPGDLAPPLDFALSGLRDWPGMLAGERLRLLLRHPCSLGVRRNGELAATALFGEEGRAAFEAALAADLAVVLPSLPPLPSRTDQPDSPGPHAGSPAGDHLSRLPEASRLLECPGEWLVTVLRWPVTG